MTRQRARTRALVEQREAGIQAIQTSADFACYLTTASKFHSYRPNSVLRILTHDPIAT